MNGWLPVVASTVALAITAGVPLVATLRSLKANRPVTEATADAQQAAANASSFNAQQGVINTLDAQVKRQGVQIAALEEKLNSTTARVEERDEQNELLAEQLRATQESLRLCRQSGQEMSDWMRTHFLDEHPGSDPPKVQWLRFNTPRKTGDR